MNELVKTLQARIEGLERQVARYESARLVCAIEIDYWRSKAMGSAELHPDSELGRLLATLT
jgi:hypothetical protein